MAKTKTETPQLYPLEVLASNAKIPTWEFAALRQAAAWAEGKQVTEAEFDTALNLLRSRPTGGGKF